MRYNRSQPVNLGSGNEISIAELVETIAGAVGFTARIAWDTSKPNGQLGRGSIHRAPRRDSVFEPGSLFRTDSVRRCGGISNSGRSRDFSLDFIQCAVL